MPLNFPAARHNTSNGDVTIKMFAARAAGYGACAPVNYAPPQCQATEQYIDANNSWTSHYRNRVVVNTPANGVGQEPHVVYMSDTALRNYNYLKGQQYAALHLDFGALEFLSTQEAHDRNKTFID